MSRRVCRVVTVSNRLGLHARPAMMLVQTARKYKAKIAIGREGASVDAKAIILILTLGATQGTDLEVIAEGDDAEEAVAAIEELFRANFHEDDEGAPTA